MSNTIHTDQLQDTAATARTARDGARLASGRRALAAMLAAAALAGLVATAANASAAVLTVKGPPPGYTVATSGAIQLNKLSLVTKASVTCPVTSSGAATYPLSGGVTFGTQNSGAFINASYPEGTAWDVTVDNSTGLATTITVSAVCALPPKHYSVRLSKPIVGALKQTSGSEVCPRGTKILGGGVIQSDTAGAYLSSTYPSDNAWNAEVDNLTGESETLQVAAVCGSKIEGYSVLTGASTRIFSSEAGTAKAMCPAPGLVIGGGVALESAGNAMLNSSAPTTPSTEWTNTAFDATTAFAEATPFVICTA
jgi:hypothetical protein